MDAIDTALAGMKQLRTEIAGYQGSIITEEDTRLKVITRIFTEVLGWPLGELLAEASAGEGFADYSFGENKLARLIVEAKRDGAAFGLSNRRPGQAYKLNGPAFEDRNVCAGIKQGIYYCGYKNAELCCLTNGREWVVFRANRVGDGTDTLEGKAFVFPNLTSICDHFKLFFDLLSPAQVKKHVFRGFFQQAEGRAIRVSEFCRTVRLPGSEHLIPRQQLSKDLDAVMTSFFRQLSGDDDPTLIVDCFVVTKESQFAQDRLARLSADMIAKIRDLDADSGEELVQLIRRAKVSGRNEFVILVGTKGAGKSTFVDRFFRHVLPADIADGCIVLKVDLANAEVGPDGVSEWLNQRLLATGEQIVFGGAPTYDELQGMFFGEYDRWRIGQYKHLYDSDKQQFKILFGTHMDDIRERRPHDYICRMLGDVVRSRKKLPCLVFDNADHYSVEFQEAVFKYARSIYQEQLCLVVVPVTDMTTWKLSRHGAIKSFDSESLYLPTPNTRRIIERRIQYIGAKVEATRKGQSAEYFFNRGIVLSLENIAAFAACLERVFVQAGVVARWIANLANFNVREILHLTRKVISSPHLNAPMLLKAYIAKSTLSLDQRSIKEAIIREGYDIYPAGHAEFVQNIFDIGSVQETTPLLGIRILQLLKDCRKRPLGRDEFVGLSELYGYLGAMGIEEPVAEEWLGSLLENELCFAYDPTVHDVTKADRVQLTPAGLQHLIWAREDWDFVRAMSEVTPYHSQHYYEQALHCCEMTTRRAQLEGIANFFEYVASEDTQFCLVPDHAQFAGQKSIGLAIADAASKLKRKLHGAT